MSTIYCACLFFRCYNVWPSKRLTFCFNRTIKLPVRIGFLISHNGEPLMKPLTAQLGWTVGRSFIPLLAVLIILGTMLWGPWVTLLIAAALWYGIGHTV